MSNVKIFDKVQTKQLTQSLRASISIDFANKW